MERTEIRTCDAWRCMGDGSWRCAGNGSWRIAMATLGSGRLTISAVWDADSVPPAGIVSFSAEGDTDVNSRMDLAKDRAGVCGSCPAFVDVDVAGLPPGGAFILHFCG